MKSKKVLWAFLIIPLVFSAVPTRVSAQTTTVSLDPQYTTVPSLGMNFTVNINISDVTNLFAYELKLYYNHTLVTGLEAELPEGHFLTPTNPTNIFVAKMEVNNTYNATHGRVWIAVLLIPPEAPKNGSGVLASVKFRSAAVNGPSVLDLAEVNLSDPDANPISHVTVDGTVTVIPEFPLGIVQLTLMLLIIAALAVFAKKRTVKPKKMP